MPTKLKDLAWKDRPRSERLSAVLYPHLSDELRQKQMNDAARQDGRRAPAQQKLLSDAERGCVSRLGGVADWKKG
jgi:hypothetical protein